MKVIKSGKSSFKKYWRGTCSFCNSTYEEDIENILLNNISSDIKMPEPHVFLDCPEPSCRVSNNKICFTQYSDEEEV